MMEIPVACTLGPAAVEPRIEQWREVLSRTVTHAERVASDRLACELRADLADLRALALLAQEEKACCGFFTFSFEVEVEAVTMMVGVPDDATSILDQFATLTSTA
jgi:hypothetical protein